MHFVNEAEIDQTLAREVQDRYLAFSLFGKFDLPLLIAMLVMCVGVAVWARQAGFVLVIGIMLLVLVAFFIPKYRSVKKELSAIRGANVSLPLWQRFEISDEVIKIKRMGYRDVKESTEKIVGYYEVDRAHALVLEDRQLIVVPKDSFVQGSSDTFFDFMYELPIRKRIF